MDPIAHSSSLLREPSPTAQAHRRYVELLAGGESRSPWWTDVVITASSVRQASRYEEEIQRRRAAGRLPVGVQYLVVPDLDGERLGSGGATLNALHALALAALPTNAIHLEDWWARRRVLLIHSGGDSRRLPQFSLSGKLFSALPVRAPWGGTNALFDELLAFSTLWAERVAGGLVVVSGDVLPVFDATALHWGRSGVCGVAIRQPVEVGSQHGVYVADEQGHVYTFLQKPTAAQMRVAGGLLDGDCVAVDSGLLHFAADVATRLSRLAGVEYRLGRWEIGEGILASTEGARPTIDLYEHFTLALTGQWLPAPEDGAASRRLCEALHGVPFWCDLVDGEFIHIGTTERFRQAMTSEMDASSLYKSQQGLEVIAPPGLHSAGVIVDSVLMGGGEIGTGAIAIECHLDVLVRAGRGSILHGLNGLPGPAIVPEDVVAHQVPIVLPDGRQGTVIRVYGVADDPKDTVASGECTWFGHPIQGILAALGMAEQEVWPGLPPEAQTLWNARLFPLGTVAQTWACARWQMGQLEEGAAELWARLPRLSLSESAQCLDVQALAETDHRRAAARWQASALALASDGADIRPLLAYVPAIATLASTGRELSKEAARIAGTAPTEAASRYLQGHLFLSRAGLAEESNQAHAAAFACVRQAVEAGNYGNPFAQGERRWRYERASVAAPARIDFGGGWSDTPPFCLDWGGTVLNMAITLEGAHPIHVALRRLPEPLLRLVSVGCGEVVAEYRRTSDVPLRPGLGSPFVVSLAALAVTGILRPQEELANSLAAYGGGLEIRTEVRLPMGSGLGTSSILAGALVRGLAALLDTPLSDRDLIASVLRLEQSITSGGGWQDQAGAIFPGAKVISSSPGLQQRLRVAPLLWSTGHQVEFAERFLLYYTGLQRIARGLLTQVVGRYLARETASVQVLHSIKTLATEMAHALCEGEWDYLGELLDRHWRLNQVLDPNTTNAPIQAILESVRPHLCGAKLVGAGGGGFLMMMARSPEDAQILREKLTATAGPGKVYTWAIARDGLQVEQTGRL